MQALHRRTALLYKSRLCYRDCMANLYMTRIRSVVHYSVFAQQSPWLTMEKSPKETERYVDPLAVG
ncbi:hypothetical protein EYF80_042902 [Liparis tanakae]|uniref:Uncharacterized protein n=1 Tax=Liparis tanakae TaxID=230148 RepID=A0A4Z2FZY3_9TELE|nr:hypothetical protein EYF80_042902 [Liparis tanakae]